MTFKKKPAFQKADNKALAKPKPSKELQEKSSIPGQVMQGLRDDLAKCENAVLISDYSMQDSITGWVSTGSFFLDCAIGWPNGLGVPYPSIIEVVGKSSSSKSSLSYTIMGNMQRMGGWGQLIDVEGNFSNDYARLAKLDVGPDTFGYLQLYRLEDVVTALQRTIERSYALAPDVKLAVCIDSLAATTTEPEQDTAFGKSPAMGQHARIMARALRSQVLPAMYVRTGKGSEETLIGRPLLIIFINQLKYTMAQSHFGPPPMDSFGGMALKYHSRVRLQVDKIMDWRDDKGDESPSGIVCKVKVIKNKVAAPYRESTFHFRFSSGIEDYIPVIDMMDRHGDIEKSGNMFVWNEKKFFLKALRDHMASNPQDWISMCKQFHKETVPKMWRDRHYIPSPSHDTEAIDSEGDDSFNIMEMK